jgi:hypothetical protein
MAAKARSAGLLGGCGGLTALESGEAELCVGVCVGERLDTDVLAVRWLRVVGTGVGFVVGFGAGVAPEVHADAAQAHTHRAASSIGRIRPSWPMWADQWMMTYQRAALSPPCQRVHGVGR